jgi:hypothetical protein
LSLYTVVTGQVANAADLNQLVNVLQQPSGGQEKGKYALGGNWAGTGSGFFSTYVPSLSRNTSPVSVAIDTADQAPIGGAVAPGTDRLSSSGFHVYSSMTNGNNGSMAGNYTIQY